MFYLKNVFLELTQEGLIREFGENFAKEEQSPGEPLGEWAARLREKGIQLLTQGSERATLWITDDAECAKAKVLRGEPVLGVLRDDLEQSFEGVRYLVSDLAEVELDYLEKVYRRQAGIPWDILETKRCILRETSLRDRDALYRIYDEPPVTDHLEKLPGDPDGFAAWLEDYAKHVYALLEYGVWTICLKRNDAMGDAPFEHLGQCDAGNNLEDLVIGRAGLGVREGCSQPELGFVIGKPWQGQGLALEVCEAILTYARDLRISEVIAFAEPENIASVGLLRRLGFEETGEINLDGKHCLAFRIVFEYNG